MFTTTLVSTALVAVFGVQSIVAAPVAEAGLRARDGDDGETVPADPVSKYTTDYFMGVKKLEPAPNTCLFYTSKLTEQAKTFADSNGLTTIWDIWPCNYYNGVTSDLTNPLRDIFNDPTDMRTYFNAMSKAMALSCDGSAKVMTGNVNQIDQTGIWGQTEQPTLQQTGNPGGQVDTIFAIDTSGGSLTTIWTRPSTKRSVFDSESVTKRTDLNDECFPPASLAFFFDDAGW